VPRGRSAQRKPTADDLTPSQRRLYDLLREEARADFLAELPPLDPSAGKKTTEQLERWIAAAEKVRDDLYYNDGIGSGAWLLCTIGRRIWCLRPPAETRIAIGKQAWLRRSSL